MTRVGPLTSPLTIVFFVLFAAGLTGCGSSNNEAPNQSITVFAADTLKGPFTELGERFKTDNPGASVQFTFGNSAELVLQLVQDTRADAFAPGDPNDMVKAEQAELVAGKPVEYAKSGPAGSGDAKAYSIAVLKDAPEPELAKKFVDLVTGEDGQKALAKAGFATP